MFPNQLTYSSITRSVSHGMILIPKSPACSTFVDGIPACVAPSVRERVHSQPLHSRASCRVFAPPRGGVPVAPLGRSPIKPSPIGKDASSSSSSAAVDAVDIPSDGGASTTAMTRPAGGRDLASFLRPAVERPNERCGLAGPDAGPTTAPKRRTSSRLAAASSGGVGGEGRTSEPTAQPGVATISANSTPSAAPPPRGNGLRPVLSSSPSSASSTFSSISGGDPRSGDTPRARTRATARARVIKGRTTVCPPTHARSTSTTSGDVEGKCAFAADAVAESPPVNSRITDPIAANNRQRREKTVGKDVGDAKMPCLDADTDWPAAGEAVFPTRIAQDSGNSSSGGEACRQGAPADGTSMVGRNRINSSCWNSRDQVLKINLIPWRGHSATRQVSRMFV